MPLLAAVLDPYPVIGAFGLTALRERSRRFPLAGHLVLGTLLSAAVRLFSGGSRARWRS